MFLRPFIFLILLLLSLRILADYKFSRPSTFISWFYYASSLTILVIFLSASILFSLLLEIYKILIYSRFFRTSISESRFVFRLSRFIDLIPAKPFISVNLFRVKYIYSTSFIFLRGSTFSRKLSLKNNFPTLVKHYKPLIFWSLQFLRSK